MPTNTYVALRKETLSTATNAVTLNLSGITGYTDLVLVVSARGSSTLYLNDNLLLNFNGDTTSNYSRVRLTGNASTVTSANGINDGSAYVGQVPNSTSGSSGFDRSSNIIHIMDYANATTFKTVLSRSNAIATSSSSTNSIEQYCNAWKKTPEAITSITVGIDSGNFVVGSTFSLYGIARGAVIPTTAKATGGTIYYGMDGYIYHKFTAGGSFVPSSTISADALIVAGGGGGGAGAVGGGGGAGGLRAFANQSLTSGTTYTVTVGGAGSAGVWEFTKGGTGGPSSISGTGLTTIEAAGGGGGGSGDQTSAGPGVSGGSGGGGNYVGLSAGGAGNTPSTSPSQGNDGAAGGPGTNFAGGGGGAGAAAQWYFGGNGTDFYSDWGSVTSSGQNVLGRFWFAGGGGGGVRNSAGITSIGGNGGGGAGSKTSVGTAGTTNTGGGGGGTGWEANNTAGGSAGGSGIVIIRYLG
jgi:hypothetical protein